MNNPEPSEREELPRPAFYAARPGAWRDWWTLLHPPYTVWHLSYVAIGASLAPHLDGMRLLWTVVAFFAAVGVAAHALDELHGHPLGTGLGSVRLLAAATAGLGVALALGVAGIDRVGTALVPCVVAGPVLLLGYNLELFGGRLHNGAGFAASWGAFPVLTAYVAQRGTVSIAAALAAIGAFALSCAQRSLSTPARLLRRRAEEVNGRVRMRDGGWLEIDTATLLEPLERALRALSYAVPALAAGMVAARL